MFLVEPTNGKTLIHVVKTSWEKMGSGKLNKNRKYDTRHKNNICLGV
jgi:hypothetical protein